MVRKERQNLQQFTTETTAATNRDAPIRQWPIIGRPMADNWRLTIGRLPINT